MAYLIRSKIVNVIGAIKSYTESIFETYAPVVQWKKVQLMLTIDIFIGLKSRKGYMTASFLLADMVEGENLYVNMPKGFEQYSKTEREKCLKLKKVLYDLRQSPHASCKQSMKKLEVFVIKKS